MIGMCFMVVISGISDQSYLRLDYKFFCKGDFSQCFEGRRIVIDKVVNIKVFY